HAVEYDGRSPDRYLETERPSYQAAIRRSIFTRRLSKFQEQYDRDFGRSILSAYQRLPRLPQRRTADHESSYRNGCPRDEGQGLWCRAADQKADRKAERLVQFHLVTYSSPRQRLRSRVHRQQRQLVSRGL